MIAKVSLVVIAKQGHEMSEMRE